MWVCYCICYGLRFFGVCLAVSVNLVVSGVGWFACLGLFSGYVFALLWVCSVSLWGVVGLSVDFAGVSCTMLQLIVLGGVWCEIYVWLGLILLYDCLLVIVYICC